MTKPIKGSFKVTFNPEYIKAVCAGFLSEDEQKEFAANRLNEILTNDLESIHASYEAVTVMLSAVNESYSEHAAVLLNNVNEKLETCLDDIREIKSFLN